MSLTSSVSISFSATHTKSLDLSTPEDSPSLTKTLAFTNGTGDNEADRIWHDQRTVADGANDDIDLAGVLVDAFGDSASMARVKVIIVENLSATATLLVGPGAASNAFATAWGGTGSYNIVPPGGFLAIAAPKATAFAVTPGTGDILRITNSVGGGEANYNIILLGASS